jgi:hypothetical protein
MENFIKEKKEAEMLRAKTQSNVIKQQFSPLTPNARRLQNHSSSGSFNQPFHFSCVQSVLSEKPSAVDLGSDASVNKPKEKTTNEEGAGFGRSTLKTPNFIEEGGIEKFEDNSLETSRAAGKLSNASGALANQSD